MLYEIHHMVRQSGSDEAPRVEQVHADNWLDALRRGLEAAGLPAPTRNLSCDLQDDESVVITDTESGQVFRVLPMKGQTKGSGQYTSSPSIRNNASLDVIRIKTPAPAAAEAVSTAPQISQQILDSGTREALRREESSLETCDDDLPSGVTPMPILMSPHAGTTVGDKSVSSLKAITYDGADNDTLPLVRPVDAEAATLPGHVGTLGPRGGIIPKPPAGSVVEEPLPSIDGDPRPVSRLEALDREMDELKHIGSDVSDACNFTLDAVRLHIPSGAGSVMLVDARDRALYFAAARGPKIAVLANKRLPLDAGVAGQSLRQRKVMMVVAPADDEHFAEAYVDYQPRSVLCAPVFAGVKAFGVVELFDREQSEGFTEGDADVLRLATRRLGEHFASLLPPADQG